jgi:hypothetical protein
MDAKDIATIGISSAAFFFAIASFYLTFKQKNVEARQATRKALTDVVAELTKVNIAFNQLRLDRPNAETSLRYRFEEITTINVDIWLIMATS